MKIAMIVSALVASLGLAASAQAADGKQVYDNVCHKCHRTGVDDAPRTGNKDAWAPRIAKGLPALYKSAIEGKDGMPARADKPELTDEELKAGVDYLISLVK